jgi:hypothetical protein
MSNKNGDAALAEFESPAFGGVLISRVSISGLLHRFRQNLMRNACGRNNKHGVSVEVSSIATTEK